MQILTFKEIKSCFRKKYGMGITASNDIIMKRLQGYQVHQKEGKCFVEVQDKQRECEKIADILYLHRRIRDSKDLSEKYSLLLQTLPERQHMAFPKTIAYHEKYIMGFVDKMKNKSVQMVQSFNALKTMLFLMDKEITEYSDAELVALIKNKEFTRTTKQHAIWFLNYIYKEQPEKCCFNVEATLLNREKLKAEDDFYSPEEWTAFINTFFDVDRHLEHAYEDCRFARYWLYSILHMSLAWRKSDVLNIPPLEILGDVGIYTLAWFESNIFTLIDAQKIINCIKLPVEQYCIQKTGARKHFNIPRIALIPTAIAFIVCEQWRRKRCDAMLFGKFNVYTKEIAELFKLETEFSSLKANRTLLSFFNEKASEINEFSGQAGFLTSYMRSHKTTMMGNSDTTTIYLHSTYDERESVGMTKQIVDRGAFGWLYHELLEMSGNGETTFKDNTNQIVELKKHVSPQQIEAISGAMYNIAKERDMLLDEIYSLHDSEIKEKAATLLRGGLLSKTDDVYCLMSNRCPYPTENNCILCRYSIPTTFSLMLVGEELKRLLLELGSQSKTDRARLTYQIGKLIIILKEAISEFGYEYIKTYIDYEEINKLITIESPNMIFLEELRSETK